MKKIIIKITLLILVAINTYSQSGLPAEIKSPNAASFGTFGDIPVNYFTGTPDISIPIYNMQSGSISLPVVLRYHPGNVRVNEHPGWVGLGWDLASYGVITRTKKGNPDENNYRTDIFEPYYGSGADLLQDADWDSETKLKQYIENSSDVYPDVFSFSFLGYSGKFYWTAEGWKVVSESNIKVKVDDFISGPGDIRMSINYAMQASNVNLYVSTTDVQRVRMFKQFTLTTDDGTQYIFGGEDAIEYIANYGEYIDQFLADSWYLKKIIDINNHEIEFNYVRKHPICRLSISDSHYYGECSIDWNNWPFPDPDPSYWYNNTLVRTTIHGGYTVFPIYLDEIVGENDILSFSTSTSTELRYTDGFFHYFDEDDNYAQSYDFSWSGGIAGDDESVFQWEQLDTIEIKYNSGTLFKKYTFDYSASSSQRLTLNSLEERDASDVVSRKYVFQYNNIPGLPGYGGDYADHWGFFNNKTIHGYDFSVLHTRKNTDTNYVTRGLLNKITYPTNGYTEFDWEAHQYDSVVNITRDGLDYETGYAGGSRIKEIRSYPNSTATPITKKFYYVSNYSDGSISGLSSSGILNGKPQYYFSVTNRETLRDMLDPMSYSFATATDLTSYSHSAGSYIGYSEVIEEKSDGSYSKYYFTNFNRDKRGVKHFDEGATGYLLGWVEGEDRYIPTSELSNERGKPTDIEHYNNNYQLVQSKRYYYDNSSSRFDEYIKAVELRNSFVCTSAPYDGVFFESAYKIFTYKYKVLSEATTIFDVNGQNPVTDSVIYTYNDLDLPSSISKTDKNNADRYSTHYTYPADFSFDAYESQYLATCNNDCSFLLAEYNSCTPDCDNTINGECGCIIGGEFNSEVCVNNCLANLTDGLSATARAIREMSNRNMVGSPIQVLKKKNGNVIGGSFTNYHVLSGGAIVPQTSYNLEINSPLTTFDDPYINSYGNLVFNTNFKPQVVYDNYDADVNLLEYHPVDGQHVSYIYGYDNTLPIAKAANADNDEIAYSGFENNNDLESFTYVGSIFTDGGKKGDGYLQMSGSASVTSKTLPSGNYKLEYWTKSDVTITGGTVTTISTSAPDASGWIYNVKMVSLTSSASIQFEGTTFIDEIRLYPKDAQMISYTYDPLVGITSETDARGYTTYYKYDDLGRLLWIKDMDGKIIEQYKYNYDSDLY